MASAGIRVVTGNTILVNLGAIVPPVPVTPTSPGNQPVAEKLQGYPQMRGFLVVSSNKISPDAGVEVDELTQ